MKQHDKLEKMAVDIGTSLTETILSLRLIIFHNL